MKSANKEETLDRYLKITLFIIGFLTILFLIGFIYRFHEYNLSENISDWGNFGSYIGGTINTLIAIGNLVVFIILSIKIVKIQDANEKRNRKIQKDTILTQFRYDSINEISIKFHQWTENLGNTANENGFHNAYNLYWESIRLEFYFLTFCQNKRHLFPEMSEENVSKDLFRFKTHFKDKKSGEIESLGEILNDYIEDSNEFISDLQQYALKELDKTV